MISPARATAVLGAGSAVSLLAGAVTAKWVAAVGGPAGVGFVGLLSSLLALLVMVAGLGIGVGLVRTVAASTRGIDVVEIDAQRQAGRRIVLAAAAVVSGTVVLLREPIAELALGGPDAADQVALVGVAVIFGALATVETGVVNGLQRVRTLSVITAASAGVLA